MVRIAVQWRQDLPALESLPLRDFAWIDHEHRCLTLREHLLGDAAEQPALERAAPMGADQDQVHAQLLCVLHDRAGYVVLLVGMDVLVHFKPRRQLGRRFCQVAQPLPGLRWAVCLQTPKEALARMEE